MENEKYIALIISDLNGQINENDAQELNSWRNSLPENETIYQETKAVWEQTANYKSEIKVDSNKAWEKISTVGGVANAFDNENYLAFTPENITTFYSSQDNVGTNIDTIDWSYVGGYEIFDVTDYQDLKILTLNYDDGDIEEFELSVVNDGKVSLYHYNSETTYDFSGRGFVQYLKGEKNVKTAKETVRNNNRKRTKVVRKTKNRRNLK